MLTRRSFQTGCMSVVADLMVPACSRAQLRGTPPSPSSGTVAGAAVAFSTSQVKLASKMVLELSRPAARVGHGTTRTKGRGNVVVSPMGLAMTMSVVALLGSDAMRASLARAMQLPGLQSPESVFDDVLVRGRSLADAKASDFPLLAANLLMLDHTAEPFAFTLDGMRQRGIDVSQEDLGSADAVLHANAWSKSHTNGLIPTILDAPPGRGGLVALDAVHFKAAWKIPFDPARSVETMFHGEDDRRFPVRMMEGQGSYLFRSERGLAAVDLPFHDPRFSLVLATRTDRVADASSLTQDAGAWLDGVGFSESAGEVRLPKLDLSASADLLAVLERLGLANHPLVGLGANAPTLRRVAQRTVFKMDEHGAEVAETTAASASRSLATDYVKLNFDKPFLFALRDKETGFIILSGYVGQVSNQA